MLQAPSLSALPDNIAWFLDFDGTLTELQDDAAAVFLPSEGPELLLAIAAGCEQACAILTGRDIEDICARVPDQLWRAGNHGMEIYAPQQMTNYAPFKSAESAQRGAPPSLVARQISAICNLYEGVFLEQKRSVFAVHYRAAPNCAPALRADLVALLPKYPDYKFQEGKDIFEFKPLGAHKGIALEKMMSITPFKGRVPVMIGDDVTDEDAMQAAIRLGGFGIKVGAGETCAAYRLADVDAVYEFLKTIVKR